MPRTFLTDDMGSRLAPLLPPERGGIVSSYGFGSDRPVICVPVHARANWTRRGDLAAPWGQALTMTIFPFGYPMHRHDRV
jgi:hypothetical protein